MRTGAALERLWQDVRYAARLMRRNAAFTCVAVTTLTLAVAANSAVFSVVEAVIFAPLSYRQPGQLVALGQVNRVITPSAVPVCAAHFAEWRRSSTSFDGLSLLQPMSFTVGISGEPERVPGAGVPANLFSVLGVPMQLGRTFTRHFGCRDEHVAVVRRCRPRQFPCGRRIPDASDRQTQCPPPIGEC
jgi:hypothetical protein